MKVSLIQSSIEWLEPYKNMANAEKLLESCVESDLVVLPEMFSTGFCMKPKEATKEWGKTLEWIVNMARKHNFAIAGGVAVEDGDNYYNRFYFVKPNGECIKYDKRHLFSYAGEHEYYNHGEDRVIVECCGVKILLLICYDLRFPVWSRNRDDYDMILVIANWPDSRRSAWNTLLKARAIENVCYVGGVNIVGDVSGVAYSGGTAAIDYKGEVVTAVEDSQIGVITFDIDMEALKRFREKFPALNDADEFEIKTKNYNI